MLLVSDASSEMVFILPLTTTPDFTNTSIPIPVVLSEPERVVYDPVEGRVYFTETELDYIASVKPDGSEYTIIVNITGPRGLAIDVEERRLYVAAENGIHSYKLDGSNWKYILSLDDSSYVKNVAFHTKTRDIYYTAPGFGEIVKIGDKEIVTIIANISYPYAITIDERDKKMFWSDYDLDTIEAADLDGKNREVLYQFNHSVKIYDMTTYFANLYFVERKTDALYRMPSDGSSAPVSVAVGTEEWENPEGVHISYTFPCLTGVSANYSNGMVTIVWSDSKYVSKYKWCGADEYQVSAESISGNHGDIILPWTSTTIAFLQLPNDVKLYNISVTPRNLPADEQPPVPGDPLYLHVEGSAIKIRWSPTTIAVGLLVIFIIGLVRDVIQ